MERMQSKRFVVVRPFAKKDETECMAILSESVMSSMYPTFFSALFREATFQLIVFFAAVLFIFVGIPFMYCVISLPLTVMCLYFFVWSSYFVKSLEIQQEMRQVKQLYQQSDKTNFWVAEYYGPVMYVVRNGPIRFLTSPEEFQEESMLTKKQGRIVGILGLQRNRDGACNLWLRRLAVTSDMRRKGIATQLLNQACNFSFEKGYSFIETCITECQTSGKEFLITRGFELEQLYHKHIAGSTAVYAKYLLRKDLSRWNSSVNV